MILQRVILKFFHRSNPPEFRILVADADADLYLSVFHQIEGLDSSKLGKCKDEFLNQAISPLDQEETDAYLQGFVQRVFPNGRFTRDKGPDTSEPVVYREPVFYLRPRRHGYTNFISEILETIPNQEEFPDSLSRILNCTESKPASAYRIDGSSRGANEDPDILLTKHANQEQLLIAKKLEKSGSVLVQGPPGTGKTHTIANLVGHLLAQGKRILITSHTNKALRVLREKVVTPLQPLCVSVLDNDSSSNRELRTAVEHIQKRLSSDDADELERQATKVLAERAILIQRLEEVRAKILQARWNESADICFAGTATRPIEGAKYVRDGVDTHDWIPAPVLLGSPLPLPDTDIKSLYRGAAAVPPADIEQASLHLPRLNETIEPDEFAKLLQLRVEALARDTSSGERFWKPVDDVSPDAVRRLETLAAELQAIVTDVADLPAWKLAAIQAGRDGGAAKEHLQKFVSSLSEEWERLFRCRTELLEHRVEFARIEPDEKALTIIESVIRHLEAGNKITFFTRITKREWVSVIDGVSVNSSSPTQVLHFRAAKAFALASVVRRKLARMWDNVMQPHGVPSASELGHTLENQCKAFIAPLTECLSWFDEKSSARSPSAFGVPLGRIPQQYSARILGTL